MLLELTIFGKSLPSEIVLFTIGWCCITSAITWLFANGKHWFAFGLIYEAIFIILLFAYLMIDGLIRGLLDWIGFLKMLRAPVEERVAIVFVFAKERDVTGQYQNISLGIKWSRSEQFAVLLEFQMKIGCVLEFHHS